MNFQYEHLVDVIEDAKNAHNGQVRKYSGIPYITHPARVAGRCQLLGMGLELQAIAWLHDAIEDTSLSYEAIKRSYGVFIAEGVHLLSSHSKIINSTGSREQKKLIDLGKIACLPPYIMEIKCIDRIDNLMSLASEINANTRDFCQTYTFESRRLLDIFKNNVTKSLTDEMEFYIKRITENCN